ncbi:BZ3500_MvSof-1268-A1-R1_C086g00470 [Microbotryum saponariae]|uniref:BZ3500_MvSof-1268-A1-R1_C043g00108 protein n=1 Tax=Microbotryum saponariae TaxID=289078 RepID=A0A2X0L2C6_9BASI|nr:BZ3501_MvSof-1269-A2-R1_C58g00324 [Microbotryum saponariae]SCZ87964.1 BZ3501_MvSof-1269-A2-R1_C58g00326 [Microbotryum saponariae]SCZ88887.1 BZ3501_MvSof-1269-A2-R1_C63g00358 [Microbotryum saponariae]SCZ92772.1 BZ3500_MvSof-1268-A1-R1_C149g00786 [Microbotryum saponariae]SCZ92841.1 BZ3500_MvSof-1268-A1-R1_C060g00275 [Microbotryum saponariae]
MLGTAFSVIIRMELASPGVQYLHGNHQLYNGAPLNFILSCWIFCGIVAILLSFGNSAKINHQGSF